MHTAVHTLQILKQYESYVKFTGFVVVLGYVYKRSEILFTPQFFRDKSEMYFTIRRHPNNLTKLPEQSQFQSYVRNEN